MSEDIVCRKRNAEGVRQVFAPDYDWSVVYVNDNKVWEGHNCETQPLSNVIETLGGTLKLYGFTNEDEIDGCTPDKFSDIIGIKELKGE